MALGSGALSGKIYGNTNDGKLWEISLSNPINNPNDNKLIASGGSRGDLIRVDPNGNSLLFTQTDSVLRLHAPSGGGFGVTAVPEPSSIAIFGIAGLGLFFRRRSAFK